MAERKPPHEPREYTYTSTEPTWDHEAHWLCLRTLLSRHASPFGRVLDIGCGNGFIAGRLIEDGYAVTGVDVSHSGVAMAAAANPRGRFLVQSAYDPLCDILGRFPIVIALEVLEHLYDPRLFIRRVLEVLEPGGTAILSTPYHGFVKNLAIVLTGKFDSHFSPLWDHGHIKFFSEPTLRKILVEAGAVQVRILRIGRVPPLAKSMVAVFSAPEESPRR